MTFMGENGAGEVLLKEKSLVDSKSLDIVCEEFAFEEFAFEELKEPKKCIISGKRGRECGY